jgi:hypothetical protein
MMHELSSVPLVATEVGHDFIARMAIQSFKATQWAWTGIIGRIQSAPLS